MCLERGAYFQMMPSSRRRGSSSERVSSEFIMGDSAAVLEAGKTDSFDRTWHQGRAMATKASHETFIEIDRSSVLSRPTFRVVCFLREYE